MNAIAKALPALPMAAVGLLIGAQPAWAAGGKEPMEFSVGEIFFELNDTDGDLGIHALIDGDPWKTLTIEDLRERKILNVRVSGRLRKQGLTEIFFESAEPSFDELPPEEFFKRFPAGEYVVKGKKQEGGKLEKDTEITHTMPSPPVPTVNGYTKVEVCDEEDPDFVPHPNVGFPVTISWPEVKMSHPDPAGGGAGVQPPIRVKVHNYQVVVEAELEIDGEEFASVLSVILPPDVTSMTIPTEFIDQPGADSFKYEVLVREESYNQTAVESCFNI